MTVALRSATPWLRALLFRVLGSYVHRFVRLPAVVLMAASGQRHKSAKHNGNDATTLLDIKKKVKLRVPRFLEATLLLSEEIQVCFTITSLIDCTPYGPRSPSYALGWFCNNQPSQALVTPVDLVAIPQFTDDTTVPSKQSEQLPVSGLPEDSLVSFVSWSQDARRVAFTVRSAGATPPLFSHDCLQVLSASHFCTSAPHKRIIRKPDVVLRAEG